MNIRGPGLTYGDLDGQLETWMNIWGPRLTSSGDLDGYLGTWMRSGF